MYHKNAKNPEKETEASDLSSFSALSGRFKLKSTENIENVTALIVS